LIVDPGGRRAFAHREQPRSGRLGFEVRGRIGGRVDNHQDEPADAPGIVIAQHIPKAFSTPFAERMNRTCQMTVCEAEDGQQIRPGHVYIAPGDRHLVIVRSGARWICRLDDGSPVNRHKPSVDVLFRSVAQQAGQNAIGVMLTGMGKDGAKGLLALKRAGWHTIAQDEKSSIVYGMPKAAAEIDAAVEILPLDRIAESITKHIREVEVAYLGG